MSNNERVKCPECGSMTLISIDREDLCSNCGKELNYDDLQQRGGKALKLWVLVVFIISIIIIALIMVPFFPHF
ncbi:MAG: hypothetical protein ACTSPZ_06060 [Promethearchaeota archaeon]